MMKSLENAASEGRKAWKTPIVRQSDVANNTHGKLVAGGGEAITYAPS